MEEWFEVKKENVIDILERTKAGFPWGEHPDEKYTCLVFYEDEVIRMTVDEFFEIDNNYECCRYYTTILADSLEEYEKLTDEQISKKAYNAWCTGAR